MNADYTQSAGGEQGASAATRRQLDVRFLNSKAPTFTSGAVSSQYISLPMRTPLLLRFLQLALVFRSQACFVNFNLSAAAFAGYARMVANLRKVKNPFFATDTAERSNGSSSCISFVYPSSLTFGGYAVHRKAERSRRRTSHASSLLAPWGAGRKVMTCLSARAAAASASLPGSAPARAEKKKGEPGTSPNEAELILSGREAALRHQERQISELLNPPSEEDGIVSGEKALTVKGFYWFLQRLSCWRAFVHPVRSSVKRLCRYERRRVLPHCGSFSRSFASRSCCGAV